MRVLVTGAGGAIGVHMVRKILAETDWHVIAVDSFRHKGDLDRLPYAVDGHEDRFTLVVHDLIAPFTVRQAAKLGSVDHIINLASLSDVQDSIDDPVPFVKNNIDVVLNMLELARQIKPRTFIQFSTDEVYGPTTEEGTAHPEWDAIVPSNPYAASKAAQEAICISYWRSYGVPVVITNTMNNFGEMQGPSKYPVKVQNAVTAGRKVPVHTASDGQIGTRYYIHSEAVADAVLHILKNTTPTGHKPGHMDRPDRYNIVGDIRLSNLDLAQRIASAMGKELDYELVDFHSTQPGHDLHYGLTSDKLAATGWNNPLPFSDALARVIDWQSRHSEWV